METGVERCSFDLKMIILKQNSNSKQTDTGDLISSKLNEKIEQARQGEDKL